MNLHNAMAIIKFVLLKLINFIFDVQNMVDT